jgi:hypothetical protein
MKMKRPDDFDTSDYEGPFGDCSNEAEPDSAATTAPPSSERKYRIPGLKGVSRSPGQDTMSDDLLNTLDIENATAVSEEDLDLFVKRVNTLSKDIVQVLLTGETEYLIALESASSYVQAFLRDCLNIDAVIDDDVMSVISSIGKANIVFHALKKMPLPKVYKAEFFRAFMEDMAVKSSEMLSGDSKSRRKLGNKPRDLEVILRRLSGTRNSRRNEPEHTPKKPTASTSSLGTKKSRTIKDT